MGTAVVILLSIIAGLLKKLYGKGSTVKGPKEEGGLVESLEELHESEEIVEDVLGTGEEERREQPRENDDRYESHITIFYRDGKATKRPLGKEEYCIRDGRVFLKNGDKHTELKDACGFNYYQVEK